MTGKTERCGWHFRYPEEVAYHDTRWCQPVHDDQELFALLCLEGQQAGLSWSLILRREAAIRKAFDDFDPRRIAQWDEAKIRQLRQDPSIIRSEAKIRAALVNARAFLAVQREFGSFDRYLWGFVDGRPVIHHPASMAEVPARSELSETISADLKRRGFRFVGPVIVYSYLQAAGLVNDHLDSCPYKYGGKGHE